MRQKGFSEVIILASILVVVFSIILIFKPEMSFKADNTSESQKNSYPTIQETKTECAKEGERPVGNLDLRTGKVDESITVVGCCEGLKKIQNKQGNITRSESGEIICKAIIGVPNTICSPCGNGICDTNYEDICNCPEDCR